VAKKPKAKTKKKREQTHEWRHIFLTVAGKNLDPEKITKVLGILPDDRGKLGEPSGKNRKCKQGYWTIEGGPSNWRIETQMKHILKRIGPVRNRLKKLIKEDKTIKRAYLTIAFETPEGIPNACYCYNSKLINEFTSLGIDIALSIHIIKEWELVFGKKTSKKRK
jgi:hypothetical protein